jgi:hypothetical protein
VLLSRWVGCEWAYPGSEHTRGEGD